MRTLGTEEEYFLIDHATCRPSPVVPDLHRELLQVNIPGTTLDTELMACQIEVVTEICSEGAQALQALFERRQVLSEICARHGYRLIAAGAPPCLPEARLVSRRRAISNCRTLYQPLFETTLSVDCTCTLASIPLPWWCG